MNLKVKVRVGERQDTAVATNKKRQALRVNKNGKT